MPRINFKATQTDFEPIPNDKYILRAESVARKKASTGNMMVEIGNVIEHGDYKGRKLLPERFVLVPQSGWRLVNFLEAAGVPHTAIPGQAKGEFDVDFDTDDIIGKVYGADIEQETYTVIKDGKVQTNADGTSKSGVRNTIKSFFKA